MKTAQTFQGLIYFFTALGIIFAGAGFWGLDSTKAKAESPELGLSVTGNTVDPGEAVIMPTILNNSNESGTLNELKVSLSPGLSYVPGTTVGLTHNEPEIVQEGDWTALRWKDRFDIPPGNSTVGFRVHSNDQFADPKAIATANGGDGVLSPASSTFTIQGAREVRRGVEIPPGITRPSPAATTGPFQINITQNQNQSQGMGQGTGQQQEVGQGQGQSANPSANVSAPAPVIVTPPAVVTPQPVVVAPQPTPSVPIVVSPQAVKKEVEAVPKAREVKKEAKELACAGDETILFDPPNPKEGEDVIIRVVSKQPSVSVRLETTGPMGNIEPTFIGVAEKGRDDPIWTWKIGRIPAGNFTFKFFINDTLLCATANLEVPPKQIREEAPFATPSAIIQQPSKFLPVTGGWNIKPFNFLAFFFSLLSFGTAATFYLKARQYLHPTWQKLGVPVKRKWYYY